MRRNTRNVFRKRFSATWLMPAMLVAASAVAGFGPWSGDESEAPGAARLRAILSCKQALETHSGLATFDVEVAMPHEKGGEAIVAGRMLIASDEGGHRPFHYRCRYNLAARTVTKVALSGALKKVSTYE